MNPFLFAPAALMLIGMRLESTHGHDAFLIEGEGVNALLKSFRDPSAKRALRPAEVIH